VAVIVADPVIVAVHVNVIPPVGVIARGAQEADRMSLRATGSITSTGDVHVHVHGHDHGDDHDHDRVDDRVHGS
jgi:hypothetical protein